MPVMMKAPNLNPVLVLNNSASISMAFGWSFPLPSTKLMVIIKAAKIKNTYPILSMKGSNGKAILRTTESGILSAAPTNAALEVVFFQKTPKKKIANTPGLINPVYS